MAHEPKAAAELVKAPPTAYRRRDAVARAQVILPIFAVLAALGFGLTEWLARGEARYSPKPLASVHSQWDNQCAACHATSQPLAANNWFAKATDQDHVADAKCQACHAGPPHHASQKRTEVVGCTACHREHQGTPGRLLAVADSNCTVCHHDLEKHSVARAVDPEIAKKLINDAFPDRPKGGEAPLSVSVAQGPSFTNVSGFTPTSHPEFALLRDKKKDPGTIGFNHHMHMIPGMGDDPAKSGPFTLAQLSPEDRERYRKPGQADDAAVTLDCRSCHQTDANDREEVKLHGLPANALTPPRGSGSLMAPIVYEQHCQACHPLTIERKVPGDVKSELLTIRHRQQPKEIVESLQGHYTNLYLKGRWKPEAIAASPVLPGKPAENKAVAKEIDAAAEAAAFKLLNADHQKVLEQKVLGQTTCQKCHTTLDPAKGIHQTVPPADIPAVWFIHARFDHTAHRAVACRECHTHAYPGEAGSKNNTDVMLPGIQTCMKCHAPAQGTGATATGGARYDCILCHTYHHGDAPLHRRGSQARQPAGAKAIREFISGK